MRILGIGLDICKNSRMQKILDNTRIRRRFLEKVLHPQEHLEEIRPEYLASRWAVKEALHKAVGNQLVVFSEVWVRKHASGQPYLEFTGQTKETLSFVSDAFVSLTHEEDVSAAVVVLTASE